MPQLQFKHDKMDAGLYPHKIYETRAILHVIANLAVSGSNQAGGGNFPAANEVPLHVVFHYHLPNVLSVEKDVKLEVMHTSIRYFFVQTNSITHSEQRISFEDDSKIILLISQSNICCDPSLKPSHRDGSN